jgi:hypothetical protein
MTTIAMAAGMLPAAYGVGLGGEFRAPMAIAVIGGLLVSTVLSLVFIPSVYVMMDDLSRGLAWLFHKIARPNFRDEPGADEEHGQAEAQPAVEIGPLPPAEQPAAPHEVIPMPPRRVGENRRDDRPRLPLAAE